jgi:hypothetical protein
MNQPTNEEFSRMQKLAGINEIVVNNPSRFADNKKALGILFHMDDNEEDSYVWDYDILTEFIADMGYKDAEDVVNEFTNYFSPGDEDEIEIFRQQENNPNLQSKDLTLGMYRKAIEKEFPEKEALNENSSPNGILKLIEMYVDNYSDEGMSAEAALEKINELLQGKLDDFDKEFISENIVKN